MNNLYSTLRGFTFNGKHNNDMNVVMHSKSIQPPSKKKIKESVPFMNGSYDFSTVGSMGEITYDDRIITIVLGLPTESKERLQLVYSSTLEWLMDVNKGPLVFDDVRSYYYMAEVETASTFEEVMSFGRLTVTLTAEPFKTSIDYVGEDIWDTFNFEEDIFQDIEFDVVATKTISINNTGRSVAVTINCSATMSVIIDNVQYNLTSGNNAFYDLSIKNGDTPIIINGVGRIKFLFRKQVL